MAKIIIAPKRFRGSLSVLTFCNIVKEEILSIFPKDQVIVCPLSDGGEETMLCYQHYRGGAMVTTPTVNPFFTNVFNNYLITDDTAIIEAVYDKEFANGSTYGIGLMIKDALSRGIKNIILALNDCAIEDMGCGMACALGTVFYDHLHQHFIPVNSTLDNITFIDMEETNNILEGVSITGLITNMKTNNNNDSLTELLKRFGHDAHFAHGCQFSIVNFLGGKLVNGPETMMEVSQLNAQIKGANLIITGEGTYDDSSINYQVIGMIEKLVEKEQLPLLILCGQYEKVMVPPKSGHLISINHQNMPLHIALKEAPNNLRYTISELIREDII